ncbi:MAG: hypothetical protein EOO16_14895 [Chitinophagaceae bacterium]|nr:MAG: hypothetical protein EOO16_14895 [Chitinophagaceae bacterium]
MTDSPYPPGYEPKPRKNVVLALALAFFFGPLGLLYASVRAGIMVLCIPVLCSVAAAVGFLADEPMIYSPAITFLIVYALCSWVLCLVLALVLSQRYNEEQQRREQMLLQEYRQSLEPA